MKRDAAVLLLVGLLFAACAMRSAWEVRVAQDDGRRCTCDAAQCVRRGIEGTCAYCSRSCTEEARKP